MNFDHLEGDFDLIRENLVATMNHYENLLSYGQFRNESEKKTIENVIHKLKSLLESYDKKNKNTLALTEHAHPHNGELNQKRKKAL